jgi:Tetracyclin repressor-like, C-terminal domain
LGLTAWAMGRGYRGVLLAHRDAARVLTVTPPLGPRRLRVMDDVIGILRQAGLSPQDVGDAGWIFNTYVTGFVLDEQTQLASSDAAQYAEVATWFRELPPEEFPNIVAVADELLDNANDRRFEFGLNVLLDGLERRSSTSAGGLDGEAPLLDLASADHLVVERHRQLDVIPVGVVDVDRHAAPAMRRPLEGHARSAEMLDPTVIGVEIDDVRVVLAPATRTRRLVLAGGKKVDDGARQRDRGRPTGAPGQRRSKHVRVKALRALHVRGHQRPVIEASNRRCRCHVCLPLAGVCAGW